MESGVVSGEIVDGAGDAAPPVGGASPMRAAQLPLFELEDRSQVHLIALYDTAPRFVFRDGQGREIIRDAASRDATPAKEAPKSIHRTFTFGADTYNLTMIPARVFRRYNADGTYTPVANPTPDEMAHIKTVDVYPGEREQIVEQVIRRIAMDRSRLFLREGDAVDAVRKRKQSAPLVNLRFSLYDARRELRAVNHSLDCRMIREALTILARTRVIITMTPGEADGQGQNRRQSHLMDSTIFPNFGVRSRPGSDDDGDDETYLTFNDLVARAIRDLSFQPVSYEWMMRLTNPVSRWILNRLTLAYAEMYQRGSIGAVTVSADEVIRNSGMNVWSRHRDTLRAVSAAVDALVDEGIFRSAEKIYEKAGCRIDSIDYVMVPSPAFVEQVRLTVQVPQANEATYREFVQEDGTAAFAQTSASQNADIRRRRNGRLTAIAKEAKAQGTAPMLPFED